MPSSNNSTPPSAYYFLLVTLILFVVAGQVVVSYACQLVEFGVVGAFPEFLQNGPFCLFEVLVGLGGLVCLFVCILLVRLASPCLLSSSMFFSMALSSSSLMR